VAELPRQSRRIQGKPPEFSPGHLEGFRALVPHSSRRLRSTEADSSAIVIHPDHQIPTTEYIQEPISVSEVTENISPTGELSDEPEISEPETESSVLETSSGFISPTSSDPGSPRVRNIITENLPSGLISIEELTNPDEDISLPNSPQSLNLRERESIFYSPIRTNPWYLSLTDFLENPGLAFYPPRVPFHPTPRGYYPSSIMAGESSMFSQTPESFLHGGPSVPAGYQSLSGTFSGATPQPIENVLSSGLDGLKIETSNAEQVYMMSGNIPNPQAQGSQFPSGGQPQGTQLPPGGQPQGSQLPPGGQPQGSQLPPGAQPQGNFFPGQTVESYYFGGQPQGQYIPQGYQPSG